jgi:hypothetical protein
MQIRPSTGIQQQNVKYWRNNMTGIEFIAKQRAEQLEKHKFSIEEDLKHNKYEQLRMGAIFVLTGDEYYYPPTWEQWFYEKISAKESKVERLAIAGALIAAEIDRLLAQ